MKRIVLSALLGIFVAITASAQIVPTIVFHERFDPPSGPDSVTNSNTNSLLTSHWNDTSALWVSAPNSYHTKIVPFDSVIFTSNTFSTIGLPYVRMKFNHICKIYFGQRGYVQVSKDNGATWSTLTGANYQGVSPQFPTVGYFNELSYPSTQLTPYWGGQSLSQASVVPPTNSWWAEETFDLTPYIGLTNVSATCKIRFIASHQVNAVVSPAGWFIDNINVAASSCELEEPTLTYNLTPLNKPVQARYQAAEILRLRARDKGGYNQGVDKDSVMVTWRLNGGPWTSNKMVATPPVAPACPDSAIFQYTWTNLLVGDTIDWYVNIYDCACPNMTRDPIQSALPNYYTFWRAPSPPAICGISAPPNSFPLVISTLPWDEAFEGAGWFPGTGTGDAGSAHRGTFPVGNPPQGLNWTVAPTQSSTGYAWSVRTGPTGTNLTGPDQDNTIAGTRYVYTEASQGNGPVTTQLTTPCIDLDGVNCAALEFYYHMYGIHTNILRVDIDTGSATSKFVIGIWSRTGQEQTNSSQPYTRAFVSLEDYAGKIIRIRFVGRKATNQSQDRGDMALDDIRVFEPIPVDVDMFTYEQPVNGFCSYTANEPVKATLQSLGCITLPEIPVAFKREFTPLVGPVVTTISRDTITGPFGLGADSSFTFGPTANLSGYGTYRMWVWSEAPGDTVNGNDTLGPFTINHDQPYSTFPLIIDFDDAGTIPGNGTAANAGTISSTVFNRSPDPTQGGYAWHVKKSTTPSAATGPITDFSGSGNYMYTEGNFGSAPVSCTFFSECISLAGLTNPVMDFRFYMFGADIGALAVQVVPVGSNSWTTIPGNQILNNAANAHTNAKSPWNYWSVNLSAYAGQVVKFRIVAQKTGTGVGADVAIDDFRIYNRVASDVGVERVQTPGTRVNLLSPAVAPVFIIRNYGSATASNFPISYTITPNCGPNAGTPTTYTGTYSGSIAAGQTGTYTVPAANIPTYAEGTFEVCASTGLTGDPYTWNNTYCSSSVGWPQVPIQTGFFEDFDNCNTGTETGFWRNGDYFVWDVGAPTSGAGSAPNCYTTRLFGTAQYPVNTYPGTEEFVYAPRFVGFDTIVSAEFWFKQKFSFGGSDAGMIEILNNGVWVPLGFQDPNNAVGINWYNAANLPSANNGSAFNGNSTQFPNTGGWVTSMWPLNVYNFSNNPLNLRWRLISAGGGTSEWSIDDVEIRIPPQNSASPVFVDTEEYIPLPDQNNTLRVRIQNTGAKRLDSCMIEFSTTGPTGPWSTPQKVVFNPPLFKGAVSGWYSFTQPWLAPPSGTYNVCIRTSRPNDKEDNLPSDDMLCKNLTVVDKITFGPNDSAYCNDFDNAALVDWIALNWPDKQGLESWEKGSPNQAPIIGAHSAPNAWMTNLTNNYRQRDSSSLFTPVFVLDSGQTYELSFWHNFKTELYHDGGSVEVSFDSWKTFRTVGYVLPDSNWFNTTHVTAIDIIRPGWTGESDGWVFSTINLAFEAGVDRNQCMFRFRFASDQSFEYQGWAVDDFCWKKKTGKEADIFIGLEEDIPEGLVGIGNVVPNPTTGETMIPYIMNNPSDVRVSIYNMVGQQFMNFEQQSEEGMNQIRFDVSGWKAGMYIIAIEVEGQITTRKVIVR